MNTVRHILPVAVAYGLIAWVTACSPPEFDLRIEDGPAPDRPAFVIGKVPSACALAPDEQANLTFLRVTRCDTPYARLDSSLWVLERTSPGRVRTRIIYGEAPEGYASRVAPQALTHGCYRVDAWSSDPHSDASQRFTVPEAAGQSRQ